MSTAAGSAGSAVYGKTLDGGEIEYLSRGQHPTGREGHLACVASGVVANLIPDCVGPCRRSDSRATGASSTIRGV